MCVECHTRVDGILHCRACLGDKARELRQGGRPGRFGRVGSLLVALVLIVPTLLLLQVLVSGAGLFGGWLSRAGAVAGLDPSRGPR